jgi:two-component system OmpR family response regulator
MRVLVVEDESALSAQLASALTEAGYVVDCARTASARIFSVRRRCTTPLSSNWVCRKWTASRSSAAGATRVNVPVLVLTARDSWHEKVRGIDGGADDYVAADSDRDSNTAEVFIARLRRKLGPGAIETLRGLGYRMVERES